MSNSESSVLVKRRHGNLRGHNTDDDGREGAESAQGVLRSSVLAAGAASISARRMRAGAGAARGAGGSASAGSRGGGGVGRSHGFDFKRLGSGVNLERDVNGCRLIGGARRNGTHVGGVEDVCQHDGIVGGSRESDYLRGRN